MDDEKANSERPEGEATGLLDEAGEPAKAWVEEALSRLSAHRRQHSLAVAALAQQLAKVHGENPGVAYMAGLTHDLAREWSRPDLLAEAERLGLEVDDYERAEPLLLHGPIVAAWLKERGWGGPAEWEAVRFHTTAAPEMGRLARIVYVADAVEPGRRYPEASRLRALALRDLDRGYGAVLEDSMRYLETRGLTVHPRMESALREVGPVGGKA